MPQTVHICLVLWHSTCRGKLLACRSMAWRDYPLACWLICCLFFFFSLCQPGSPRSWISVFRSSGAAYGNPTWFILSHTSLHGMTMISGKNQLMFATACFLFVFTSCIVKPGEWVSFHHFCPDNGCCFSGNGLYFSFWKGLGPITVIRSCLPRSYLLNITIIFIL